MSKQYFEKLDTKRYNEFRKVELSIVSNAEKLEKDFETTSKELNKSIKLLSDESSATGLLQQDVYDELQLIKKEKTRLDTATENLINFRDEARLEVQLLEEMISFAESEIKKVAQAAKDLGIKPVDIPVYVRLFKKTKIAKDTLIQADTVIKFSERNISAAIKVQQLLFNIK